jgi:hypothetical protein
MCKAFQGFRTLLEGNISLILVIKKVAINIGFILIYYRALALF